MEVTAWSNGGNTFGIRVGAANRREFFDDSWTSVEVDVEGQLHTFALTEGFWRQCPEVRDRGAPVIREWLDRHRTLNWPKGHPPTFELVPLGANRFRLIP